MATASAGRPAGVIRRASLGSFAVAAVATGAWVNRARAEGPPSECDPEVACPGTVVAFPDLAIEVAVEVAATPSTRARGLGGHAALGDLEGMLFAFETPGRYPFWMKGMDFPIDMIWLVAATGGEELLVVVHVAPDVQVDPPGTPDAARPTYSPVSPATHVLEVNAGFAAMNGIGPGAVAIVRPAPQLDNDGAASA